MAAADANPLFAGAPIIDWFLSYDSAAMVASHRAVWDLIQGELTEMGVGTYLINHEDVEQSYQLLPQERGRFFIINMYAPDEPRPLPLVFNFHNLYFAGFQHENRWYLFNDADLLGSGHDQPENIDHWTFLGFNGGYRGNMLTSVNVGINELIATCETLIRADVYMAGQRIVVEKCCFRIIVMLCEAWRFPWWNERLQGILEYYLSCPVDSPHINVDTFTELFHSWDTISKLLLRGPLLFDPLLLPRFPYYGLMVPAVDVLLRPQLGMDAADEQ